MKRLRVSIGVLSVGLAALLLPAGVAAQDEAPRKIIQKVAPAYPAMGRQIQLSGTVKLLLVVTPEGKVKSVKVTGGHPVLAGPAEDAAKKWTFEPGKKETSENVSVVFDYSAGR